jgi:hypothetical protein
MTKKKKGCLFTLLGLVVLLGVTVIVALWMIPGEVRFGGAPAKYVVAPANRPGTAASGTSAPARPGAQATQAVSPAPLKPALFEMRYLVPDEMWQREVSAMFPITDDVSGVIKLDLANPKFVRDPDGRFLRIALDLVARVPASAGGKPEDRYPGRAEVRTRLRYDPGSRRVTLAEPELVDFSFSGEAAKYAAPLVPVLRLALPAEMDGFEIVKLPEKGGFWQQTGISLVRNVVVEDGKVAVVVGR